jgi:hypothetical protein
MSKTRNLKLASDRKLSGLVSILFDAESVSEVYGRDGSVGRRVKAQGMNALIRSSESVDI